MNESFIKITIGFVCQTFRKNTDGQFACMEQAFIAGDEVSYEDIDGNPLKEIPEYLYQPYEMASPRGQHQKVHYFLYNDVLGSMEGEDPIEADSLEDALSQVLRNMGYSVIAAQKRKDE